MNGADPKKEKWRASMTLIALVYKFLVSVILCERRCFVIFQNVRLSIWPVRLAKARGSVMILKKSVHIASILKNLIECFKVSNLKVQ